MEAVAAPPPVPPPPPTASTAEAGGVSPATLDTNNNDNNNTNRNAATTKATTNATATGPSSSGTPLPQYQPLLLQQPRPSQQRNSELEELRQKGLATLLNKHFTGVITTLSKEKAEADAQLRDLEQRKANTSEFIESTRAGGQGGGGGGGGGQLSPFDALYVQLKKKRNECRRKERETLLLYQRYVHKFGATGVVQVPATATVAPPPVSSPPPLDSYLRSNHAAGAAAVLVPTMAQAIDAKVTELKQMGVDPIPTRDRMGVDTTYQTIHARDAMELQQFFRRQLEERGIDARCCTVSPGTMNPRKLFHGPRFPGGLPQLMESPGSPDSKQLNTTPWQYAFPGDLTTTPLYHHTEGDEDAGDDDEDNEQQLLQQQQIGASAVDRFYYQPQQQEYMQDVGGFSGYVVNNNSYPHHDDEEGDIDEDYDDRSMVSGLTSVNSAATMLMHETENRLVQFLKTETEAIRKMLAEESGGGAAADRHHNSDTRSVKSGKSAAGVSVVSASDHNSSSSAHMSHHNSDLGSHSSRAADQAEHMVKQMQDILNQFQQEAAARGETIVTGVNGTPTTTSAAAAANNTPRKIPTSNPNEDWVAYFDDTYQKEYYHEVNSNRTQWELPEGAIATGSSLIPRSSSPGANTLAASECTATTATASLMTDYGQQQSNLHKTALMISHEDVMPDTHHHHHHHRRDTLGTSLNSMSSNNSNHHDGGGGGGRSRRSMYLKRLRRQRKRRSMMIVAVAVVMASTTLVWKQQYHRHETWPDAAKVIVGDTMVNRILYVQQVTMRALSQVVGGNKAQPMLDDETMTRAVIDMQGLNATIMEEDVETTAAEDEEDVAMDSNATATTTSVDDDASLIVETVMEEEESDNDAMAVAVLEEDTSLVVVPDKIRRPWACNLPLAWLFHPVCRRLAHESPLYCAHSLTMSMMQ